MSEGNIALTTAPVETVKNNTGDHERQLCQLLMMAALEHLTTFHESVEETKVVFKQFQIANHYMAMYHFARAEYGSSWICARILNQLDQEKPFLLLTEDDLAALVGLFRITIYPRSSIVNDVWTIPVYLARYIELQIVSKTCPVDRISHKINEMTTTIQGNAKVSIVEYNMLFMARNMCARQLKNRPQSEKWQ